MTIDRALVSEAADYHDQNGIRNLHLRRWEFPPPAYGHSPSHQQCRRLACHLRHSFKTCTVHDTLSAADWVLGCMYLHKSRLTASAYGRLWKAVRRTEAPSFSNCSTLPYGYGHLMLNHLELAGGTETESHTQLRKRRAPLARPSAAPVLLCNRSLPAYLTSYQRLSLLKP